VGEEWPDAVGDEDERGGRESDGTERGPGLALALDLCGGDGVGDGSLRYDHVNVDGRS
jgi:hypothetical protein